MGIQREKTLEVSAMKYLSFQGHPLPPPGEPAVLGVDRQTPVRGKAWNKEMAGQDEDNQRESSAMSVNDVSHVQD
eukprot:5486311-Pyramimonas_sp.AAC.1